MAKLFLWAYICKSGKTVHPNFILLNEIDSLK